MTQSFKWKLFSIVMFLLIAATHASAQTPTITSIYPTTGTIGTPVQITGTNFGTTGTVSLNGTVAVVETWNSTTINALVPVGATSGTFSVTVSGNTAHSTTFTITSVPAGWSDTDIGTVGAAGSASYGSGTFTVNSSGQQIGSTADGMNFLSQPLVGDGTIVARLVNLQGSATNAVAGVMIRETLNAGATNAFVGFSNPYAAAEFPVRSSTGASTVDEGTFTLSMPVWLMLVRSGSSISAYTSSTGYSWRQLATTQTVTIAQSVYVGLGIASGYTGNLATANFDNVSITSGSAPAPIISGLSATTGAAGSQVTISGSNFGSEVGLVKLSGTLVTMGTWSNTSISVTIPSGATSGPLVVTTAPSMNCSNPINFEITSQPLPAPWDNADVGVVGGPGNSTFTNRVFTVTSLGVGISGTADGMQFVYQPLSGDGTIVARVVSINEAFGGSGAGVMIRESLDPAATSAFMDFSAAYNEDLLYVRASTGASNANVAASYLAAPVWVMLVRAGNIISAYSSANGFEWKQVGTNQSVTMAQNVYVGLAVASGGTSYTATATFDNVSVSPLVAPAPNITALSSTTASVGSQLVLSGTDFGSTTGIVTLNGATTTVNSWSDTSITITIPAGTTSGLIAVCVTPTMNFSNQLYFEVTSQPLPSSWDNEDLGAIGQVGSSTYSGGVFTLTSTGQGISNTSDGIQFLYQSLSANGTIVARVVSVQGSASAIAGVMIRETLTPSATNATAAYWAGNPTVAFNARPTTGATNVQEGTIPNSPPLPYWVMLVRNGNSISAYGCSDGLNWVQMGSSHTITMVQSVYVGLFLASSNTTVLATATFDNVSITSQSAPAPVITRVSGTTGSVGSQVIISGSGFGVSQGSSSVLLHGAPVTVTSWTTNSITITIPTGATSGVLAVVVAPAMIESNPIEFTVTSQPLPGPWLDQDVGAVGIIGTATYASPTFTVNGSGTGMQTTSDGSHVAYEPLIGDGAIVARVVTVQGTATVAGVAMRETLTGSAANASAAYWIAYPAVQFYDRASTGATEAAVGGVPGSPALPYWVKLIRSGNIFSAYASSNGTSWTQMGSSQTIPMASNIYVGLMVESGNNANLATATFDNVSFSAVLMPYILSIAPTSGPVGTSVTITGTSFGTTQGTVTFNGAAASSITSWTNTAIVAKVPATVTTGPVVVTVGLVASNANLSFTAFNPVISSLSPPSSGVNGIITISGTGFGAYQNGGSVSFNGATAQVRTWSDTAITAFVPTSAMTGPVTVTMNSVTSSGVQFTLTNPLSITALSSAAGTIGQTITVTGTGFGATQSGSILNFNGVPASVASWGDTSIVATVPAGSTTGPVGVQVAGRTSLGPIFTISTSLTLTDSLGNQSTYSSVMVGGKWYVNNSQGSGCSTCTVRGNIQTQYDNFGNVVLRTDALGHTTSYTYDSNQNLTSVSQPVGSGNATTTYTYNSFGEPLTVTDPLGNVTTNAYDANGNLLSVTTPAPSGSIAPSVTRFAYNSLGELTQITDPLGRITKLTYTSVGLIYTITDAQNNVTTYAYDSRGNRTSVTDAMNNQTTFAYDSGNRLLTITYPGNTTTVFTYDYRGRRTSVTDQNSKKTTYAYDDADRLSTVTDAANNVTTYSYDTENNLASIQDANLHTTSFTYDAFGRVTKTTFPSGYVETYGYDANNNLTNKTDRKNQSISYTYDQLNRLTQKTYPDSTAVNYTYDNDSRLTQVSDPTGTYQFTFDNMGRLTAATTQYTFLTGRNFATGYSYDAASNRTGFTDPESGSTSYVYDTLNRLQTLTPPAAFTASGSFGFSYDALSRRTQMTRPNGLSSNYMFDNLSRLLSVLHQSGSTILDGASYTVDNAGNRTSKTDKQANLTSNYTYDPLYQLTQVAQSATTTESYSYDPVGNRLSSLGVSSYTTNTSNELTGTSNATYTYDYNGNTQTKVVGSNTTSYVWDFENRMTSVTLPGTGGTVSFKYDSFGRRIYKSSSIGTSIHAYDGDNLIEETNASGAVVARYSQGLDIDEPLAMLRSSATSFYNADGLGSITSLANAAGALAQTYTFDSFGKQTASSGSLVNPFQYTARESDSETGLYYYRARYYDPQTGRFLNEDPTRYAGGNVNFYPYASNAPTRLIDPVGLATVTNNTGSPILVWGNPGAGHGTSGGNVYGVIPSDGKLYGGGDNPIKSYATPQEAVDAYYRNGPTPKPAGNLLDVDFYSPTPLAPNAPAPCITDNPQKIIGDDKGPHYTLKKDKNGKIVDSYNRLEYPPAAFRRIVDDINDYIDQHAPWIRYTPVYWPR